MKTSLEGSQFGLSWLKTASVIALAVFDIFVALVITSQGFAPISDSVNLGQASLTTAVAGGSDCPAILDTYVISTLANSGAGSFRDAVSAGNRSITFNISDGGGDILLASDVRVRGSCITIDGSFASARGITLRNFGLRIRGTDGAHDITMKHIRIRDVAPDHDALQIAAGAYNILIDHVSVTQAGDGNLDVTEVGTRNVTIRNSIIAAPKPDINQDDLDNEKNMLLGNGATDIHLYNNIIGFANQRNPEISFDQHGGTVDTGTTVDMRNNIVWNWDGTKKKGQRGTRVEFGSRANLVNNYFGGTSDHADRAFIVCQGLTADQCESLQNIGFAYTSGNKTLDVAEDLNTRGNVATEFPVINASGFVTQSACLGAAITLADVGAQPRDALDASYVNQIQPCVNFSDIFIRQMKVFQDRMDTKLTLTARVRNQGTLTTVPMTGRITLDNHQVAVVTIPPLAPGAERNVAWKGSGATTTVEHQVQFCADSDNAISEINEKNNCFKSSKFAVGLAASSPRPAQADIFIDRLTTLRSELVKGSGSVFFQVRLRNQGSVSAANMVTSFTVDGVMLPSLPVQTLAPGAAATQKTTYTFDAKPRKHTFKVCADATSMVAESNELNNCIAGIFYMVDTGVDPLVNALMQAQADGEAAISDSQIQTLFDPRSARILPAPSPAAILDSAPEE